MDRSKLAARIICFVLAGLFVASLITVPLVYLFLN